jgi:hypothetical protein
MTSRANPPMPTPRPAAPRYFLYALGGIFVAVGFALEMVPNLANATPWWSGRACAFIGVVFLSIGRFASDRIVRRCESLLTGWP